MPRHTHSRIAILVGALSCIAVLALAGCGGSAASNASAPDTNHAPSASFGQDGSTGSGGTLATPGSTNTSSAQFLSKTLNIDMTVTDTRKSADEIQTWVATTDARSTSAGTSYSDIGNQLYRVSMTFSVQATLYPQVASYMRDYGEKHGGRLLSYNETVQDLTNDFVDTDSRLTNLRAEQQRLLTFLSQSQSLSDTLQVEQRLTDVEGQIENIEAHLNSISGQVTFYPVTVVLEPASTDVPEGQPWTPLSTLRSALAAALIFAEFLGNVIIWLAVFSVFAIPVIIAIVLWRRYRRAHPRVVATPVYAAAVPPPPAMPGPSWPTPPNPPEQ